MKKLSALLLVLSMPLSGCGWFGIGGPSTAVPVVSTTSDGNRVIAIEKFGLQITEPSDVHLEMDNVGSNHVVMFWSRNGRYLHHLQIDTKTRYMHEDLESMKNEYDATYTSFRVGEERVLDNGFDLYYSYWNNGARRLGYQAEITLDDKKYRCLATGGITIPVMKAAREMCRSLTTLKHPLPKSAE